VISAAVFTFSTTVTLAWIGYRESSGSLLLARNFYGPLRVFDENTAFEKTRLRVLVNGKISHGAEAPARPREPLTYYSRESGLGFAMSELQKDGGQLRLGMVGLGVGTIAGYGRQGDVLRFYEINPLVLRIAHEDFWYLRTSRAQCDVVLGDARLSLEREPSQHFDLLAIDAFISDSIPMHLLTREAFALYWRHLKPDGVLAIHVSNRYADLAPIVALNAKADAKAAWLFNTKGKTPGSTRADWVLVTSRPGFFDGANFRNKRAIVSPAGLRVWTDDYGSIWSVLKLR
jgi:hypothetical protein